ncbi:MULTISPECIES: hypothetical protein [unclassified Nocardioides]|uniref:hypothetical protein n=1 Tax=unclassified Nocardioides TaxID=2615069 RepID=UPI002406DD3C|nr:MULTISPECIES: hypothetical protein [unclassified Nocardioides]
MDPHDLPEPPRPLPPSARVRVTGPPRRAVRRTTGAEQIDAGTAVGEVYLRSLLREQLRLGLLTVGGLVVGLGGLPALFYLVPSLADVRMLGVPLAWAVLAGAVYPLLFGLGWLHVRRAEANERDFAELVARRAGEEQG